MKTISFNSNNCIQIKITEHGLAHMKKKYESLMGRDVKKYPFTSPDIDENGYSRMQMHSVMYWFGDSCSNGMPVPFDTNILIEHDIRET